MKCLKYIFLISDFCAYVTSHTPKENHVITANEGNAIALATGYHLATGKHAMVYLQVCMLYFKKQKKKMCKLLRDQF